MSGSPERPSSPEFGWIGLPGVRRKCLSIFCGLFAIGGAAALLLNDHKDTVISSPQLAGTGQEVVVDQHDLVRDGYLFAAGGLLAVVGTTASVGLAVALTDTRR